ncbi:uncharacterized protein LOC141799905 isoform X2 [Halichoeres trimaculatus]|uniref:uncharacterized protein LOC141799905 isoform X2 n=1 Tax=Halichoeres trimaculatus TaxID=147232 RepID=UPI003D9E3389
MHSSSARPQTLKVWCVQVCVFYSTMCLSGWPLSSEAARLRCGSDLLSDLIFVCGDRGIYLGKGTWSGYGARPRGKGIVDQCCRPSGCELQHLELYCAKPKNQPRTTAYPSTTMAPRTTAQQDMAQQLFQTVFQKRLLQQLGAPNSPKREAYRKKTKSSLRGKSKVLSSSSSPSSSSSSSSRRRTNSTSTPPPATSRSQTVASSGS